MRTRQRAELLQAFADALPFGAYVLDHEGIVVVWNRAAERITGYLGQALLGRPFDKNLLVAAQHGACAAEGAGVCEANTESYVRHREGHRIPVHASRVELRSEEEGGAIGTAEFFHEKDPGVADPDLCWLYGRSGLSRAQLGVPAYETSRQQLRQYVEERWNKLAVFFIRVRQLAEFQKHCGHEMVHVTLRTVAQTISHLLRVPHYFGSWGGDQFLVLVPECPRETFSEFVRKLESVGSACEVSWWGDSIVPYVEVLGTYIDDAAKGQELLVNMGVVRTDGDQARGEPDRCS
jgi:PAS domain S-box-containing protein